MHIQPLPVPLQPSRSGVTASGGAIASAWKELSTPHQIARWDALALMAAEPNPFFESWYLLPGLRAFDPQGRIKLLRLEADGALLGVMPLARSLFYYGRPVPHLGNWIHPNCFLGCPLVAAGAEEQFWRAMLAWADRNAGFGLFLHAACLPMEGPLFNALKRVLVDERRPAALVHRAERAMLCSALSPETYFEQSLSAKKRKELRRQFNRLSEEGHIAITRETGTDEIGQWLSTFLALERAGWKGKAGSALASDERTSDLFTQALQGAAERGRLERLSLTLDGRPIAMLANFLTAPGGFSYKTAFDENYARFSPSVLLQRENLAMLDREGIDWCDSCAAQDHPMIDHLWRDRRSIGRVSIAIGGKARRALFTQIIRMETGTAPGGI